MRRSCISFPIFEDFISLILRVEVGVSQVSSKRFFQGGILYLQSSKLDFEGFFVCVGRHLFFFSFRNTD